jgi:hypothetical protein
VEGIVKMDEGLTGPTFRIRVRLQAGDDVIAQVASIESAMGVSSVLDRDGSIRLQHARLGNPPADWSCSAYCVALAVFPNRCLNHVKH